KIDQLQLLSETYANKLRKTTDLATIVGFATNNYVIESLFGHFSESVMRRHSTVDDYYEVLRDAFANMSFNRKVYTDHLTGKLRKSFHQDTHELKLWHAYFTRQNLAISAVSIVLIV